MSGPRTCSDPLMISGPRVTNAVPCLLSAGVSLGPDHTSLNHGIPKTRPRQAGRTGTCPSATPFRREASTNAVRNIAARPKYRHPRESPERRRNSRRVILISNYVSGQEDPGYSSETRTGTEVQLGVTAHISIEWQSRWTGYLTDATL